MKKLFDIPINKQKAGYVLFFLFMAIGIFARVWKLAEVPGGVNQDEAFGAYEAYSLLHYGVDSNGHSFPVYLETWGSGMSALNSYLMIPLIALFGFDIGVTRTPQAVVACFTLWAVYSVMKRVVNEKAALCSLFLLAISPWHILMSRWGLDANLAPGFVIFGLLFFVKGLDNAKYFILSAVMYGLSLYCYATIWPFVPLIILLQFIYCFMYKKVSFSKEIIISGIVLFLMALPLLLFLLVNKGLIGEINIGAVSIPKMGYMRASEISFSNIIPNMKDLWYIIQRQSDGLIWNIADDYGIFYLFTLPFFFLGVFFYVVRIVKHLLQKHFTPEMFIMIQLLAGGLLGLLISANVNRVNILFIPMIIIAASGIYFLCEMADIRLLVIPLVIYSVSFVKFELFYFTDYKEQLSPWFAYGMEEALEEACSYDGTVYVKALNCYPRIMYYREIPVTDFLETVERYDYDDGTREVVGFERFCFKFDAMNPVPDAIYLLDNTVDLTPYEKGNFELKYFDNYIVAVPEAF